LAEEEAAAVARRRRARGRQDGEGRERVKGAEGKKEERLAAAAAVAGGRRRSSIAGDGKGRRRLSQLCSSRGCGSGSGWRLKLETCKKVPVIWEFIRVRPIAQ
jgi:hypothetical protein